MPNNPSILLIYTGGTIGMIEDPGSRSLLPFSVEHLLEFVPRLSKMNVDIKVESFSKPLDSAHIGPAEWLDLRDIIHKNYNSFDGFVVLHGTDTMAYSASALGFLLEGLKKPVIFTGSQLPISTVRSDAQENLITAVEIASAQKDGLPRIPEVAVLFDNNLYRGVRSTKYNAENFDAFQSPNFPVLAKAGVKILYNIQKRVSKEPKFHDKVDKNVVLLSLYPGIDDRYIESIISNSWVKGIVLETFGTGTVNLSEKCVTQLKKVIDSGVVVVATSQCNVGSVEIGRYEASGPLSSAGVLSGGDMTTEAALTKLMILLGNYSANKVKELISEDIVGEITL